MNSVRNGLPATGQAVSDTRRSVTYSPICALLLVASLGSGAPAAAHAVPAAQQATSCTAPPRYLGLDAYRHVNALSYLNIGDRMMGQSTADPAGSNTDNVHIMRMLPDGERVLFDQTGPGIMTFMRMQEAYGGPWKLYLDGIYRTTVHAGDLGQMQPSGFPANAFPFPLSMNSAETHGSSIVATAIPFARSMRWTATGPNGNFYALYRRLPYGTPLTSWDSGMLTADVTAALRNDNPLLPPVLAERHGTAMLPPGHETTIAQLSGGPRQLRLLRFRVPSAEQEQLGAARLRIYWDGEATPSVDAPLKFMAGDGAGVYQPAGHALVRSWLMHVAGDGTGMIFTLRWPMPFHSSARIALSAATPLRGIDWTVGYEPFSDPPNWWGTFHATYTEIPHPVAGQDMTFLDVTGSGRIVGTVINFSAIGSTLEGDPRVYLDDSRTPQIAVTGTEEWGLGGDYWQGGQQTSLALGGLPSSTNNPPGAVDGAALYRVLIADSIPYNRHAVIRWEHGGADESSEPYRAAVFWYGVPTQTALVSDVLDLGQEHSRAAHGYRVSNGRSYHLAAAYEYPVRSAVSSGDGMAMTGPSTFHMALDPRNSGAFLRRTFDYGVANQRADIFVDGHFAGTWYSAGRSLGNDRDGHQRRWRDEDFPLPPALTDGKSTILIEIRPVSTTDPPNGAWTAFQYGMYSLVLPGCDR